MTSGDLRARTPGLPGADDGWLLTRGSGEPVTLYAHGFGGSIADTRPFARGVPGTGAFMHFRGHGGRPSPGPHWDYEGLAAELGEARRRSGATRALGVSMGAGALARHLTDGGSDLERAALVLPAVLDRPSEAAASRGEELNDAVADGDIGTLARMLLSTEPAAVQQNPQARAWASGRARALVETDQRHGLSLLAETAVDDRAALARIDVPVLVLTHEDDPAHPVEVAREYAEALPRAELVVLPPGSILWLGRDTIREVMSEFFHD